MAEISNSVKMVTISDEFLVKLKQSFDLLFINNHEVTDDTLLQTFLSLLENILSSDNGDQHYTIINTIDFTEWMANFELTWKNLDPKVAAFGFNVIGLLTSCNVGRKVLAENNLPLKRFLHSVDLSNELNASVCCSVLTLYRKFINVSVVENILATDLVEKAIDILGNDNIYVTRASKDLISQMLVKLLSLSEVDLENCNKLLRRIFEEAFKFKNVTKSRVLVEIILHFLPIAANKFHLDEETVKFFNSKLLDYLQNSSDDILSNDMCKISLILKNSIDGDYRPNLNWTSIFTTLIEKGKLVWATKFISSTLKIQIEHKVIPSKNLVSMFVYPLFTFCGKVDNGKKTWDFNNIPEVYIIALRELKYKNQIISYVIASILDVREGFSADNEKLNLIKVLVFILFEIQCGNSNLKIGQVTVDSLVDLINACDDKWFKTLKQEESRALIMDCLQLLKQALPTSMTSRVTKLLLAMFTKCWETVQLIWEESIGIELKGIIHLKCHDPVWETRDSAFEFLADIVKFTKKSKNILSWLKESQLLQLCVVAFEDQQDYVRASAVNSFAECSVADFNLKDDILGMIARLLLFDSEAVVRRAAANVFHRWMENYTFKEDELKIVYPVMVKCCYDLDWEVKLSGIKFWSLVLEKNTHQNPSEIFEALLKCGFFKSLSILIKDEDFTVVRKSADVLYSVQKFMPIFSYEISDCTNEVELVENVRRDRTPIEIRVMPCDDLIIESVLDTNDMDIMENEILSVSNEQIIARFDKVLTETELSVSERQLNILKNFCFNRNSASTDIYELNPESLLDDIMKCNIKSHNDDDEDEDNVIDCY